MIYVEHWPWHVAIMQLKNNKFDYHCGGTLISEKAILTAAHCVTILSTSKLIDKEMFILYMGESPFAKSPPSLQISIISSSVLARKQV